MILLETDRRNAATSGKNEGPEEYAGFGDGEGIGHGDGDGSAEDADEASEYTPPHVRMCVSQMYLLAQVLEPDP